MRRLGRLKKGVPRPPVELLSICVRARPAGPLPLRTYSGTAVESAVLRLLGLPHDGVKPISVTPLIRRRDGRALIRPAVVPAGEPLQFRIATLDPRHLDAVASARSIALAAQLEVEEVEVRQVAPPGGPPPARFRLHFLTPARFRPHRYARAYADIYDPLPSPRNIFLTAHRTARALGLKPATLAALKHVITNTALVQLRCPASGCVQSVPLSNGRKAIGLVATAAYRTWVKERHGQALWNLLTVAQHFNLSVGRTAGFGLIRLEAEGAPDDPCIPQASGPRPASGPTPEPP